MSPSREFKLRAFNFDDLNYPELRAHFEQPRVEPSEVTFEGALAGLKQLPQEIAEHGAESQDDVALALHKWASAFHDMHSAKMPLYDVEKKEQRTTALEKVLNSLFA
ncbi:hypothetical protein QFC20_003707 [Naganishia adeliensis]|uniref:Uncharacterized protein n=1 Tax=Naganishia adeliensis TaxID=92952 RepID=A0ACC2WB03_9TREE|nr:hypothetical protein QFC20_003707 [Naganishia adeliensis]